MPSAHRSGFAVLLCLAALLAQAPARAQDSEAEVEPRDQIVLSGDVLVRRGEEVGEVVVLHGTVTVSGVVRGDVVVVDGRILVTGQVSGSVVSLSGPVELGANAQVGGDVISRDPVQIQPGARVDGRIREGTAFTFRTPIELFGPFATWLAVATSSLLLGLALMFLAPRGADAVARAAHRAPRASLGWGVAVFAGLPVLSVLGLISLVALPLGLGVLLALLLLCSVGFVWSMHSVGRLIWREPRTRWLAFAIGWVIVAALSAIPSVGGVVWLAGSVFGLGAMTVAAWSARRSGGRHRPGLTRAPIGAQDMEEGVGL